MTKIPFNIKYQQQIKSGEVKVVARDDRSVKILKWDMHGNYPILAVIMTDQTNYEGDETWQEERPFAYSVEGHRSGAPTKDKLRLFILNEKYYTDFEKYFGKLIRSYASAMGIPVKEQPEDKELDFIKKHAPSLLSVAYKQIMEELPVWKKVQQGNYVLEPHLGKKTDGTYSLFTDHTLRPDQVEYIIAVSEFEKLKKES